MARTLCIIDDDDDVRASLRSLFSSQPELVLRAYASGDAFLKDADDLEPSVLLLDFHMPGASGIDVLLALRDKHKFAAVMLTGKGNIDVAVEAMKAGAVDFTEKPYEVEALLECVRGAFDHLFEKGRSVAHAEEAKAQIARLSARESEVLVGLIEGKANKVIAYDLDISPRTVEIYRANLMDKLGARSLSDALRIAFAAGLLPE